MTMSADVRTDDKGADDANGVGNGGATCETSASLLAKSEAEQRSTAVANFRCPRTGLSPLLAALVYGCGPDLNPSDAGCGQTATTPLASDSSSGDDRNDISNSSNSDSNSKNNTSGEHPKEGTASSSCTGSVTVAVSGEPPLPALVSVLVALLRAGADLRASAALYDHMGASELAAKFNREAALQEALALFRAAPDQLDQHEASNYDDGLGQGHRQNHSNDAADATTSTDAAPTPDLCESGSLLPPAPPSYMAEEEEGSNRVDHRFLCRGCGELTTEADRRNLPMDHQGIKAGVWHQKCLSEAAKRGGCPVSHG